MTGARRRGGKGGAEKKIGRTRTAAAGGREIEQWIAEQKLAGEPHSRKDAANHFGLELTTVESRIKSSRREARLAVEQSAEPTPQPTERAAQPTEAAATAPASAPAPARTASALHGVTMMRRPRPTVTQLKYFDPPRLPPQKVIIIIKGGDDSDGG